MAERIAIVADHAAFETRMLPIEPPRSGGHDALDLGTPSSDTVDRFLATPFGGGRVDQLSNPVFARENA